MKIKFSVFCVMIMGGLSAVTKKKLNPTEPRENNFHQVQEQNLFVEIEIGRITEIINLIERDEMTEEQRRTRLGDASLSVSHNQFISPHQKAELLMRIMRLLNESRFRQNPSRIEDIEGSINRIRADELIDEKTRLRSLEAIQQQLEQEGSWGGREDERQRLLNKVRLIIENLKFDSTQEMLNDIERLQDLYNKELARLLEEASSDSILEFVNKVLDRNKRHEEVFQLLYNELNTLNRIEEGSKKRVLKQIEKLRDGNNKIEKSFLDLKHRITQSSGEIISWFKKGKNVLWAMLGIGAVGVTSYYLWNKFK